MGGTRYERELVNTLGTCGYAAMRAPSSGAATDRDLPDVLAGQRVDVDGRTGPIATYARALAIELKVTKGTTAYAAEAEIESLGAFSYAFGAKPLLAAKFKRQGGARSLYYLVEPGECRKTKKGTYGIPESDAEERAWALVYTETANEEAAVEVLA